MASRISTSHGSPATLCKSRVTTPLVAFWYSTLNSYPSNHDVYIDELLLKYSIIYALYEV